MAQYIIKGGTPLTGNVNISGAKNAVLPILAASIMSDEPVVLENVPDVSDVNVMIESLKGLGVHVEKLDRHTIKIIGSTLNKLSVDYDCIKKIRASYYLLGALLGKYGQAEVPIPGGCNIGSRPIDQHIKGFKTIGANIRIENGNIIAEAAHMHGEDVYLDIISVGATINVMLAAVMAEGQTIIENAAKEPHVVDTANFLNNMGAHIRGAGTDVIRIKGVEKLYGCTYSIAPDMIEAGTYMMAAPATGGDITIHNVIPRHIDAITAKLYEIGCDIEEGDEWIRVISSKRIRQTNVKTLPYPGFPTDMQPQMTTILALGSGTSMVTESIFENRFKYVDELTRMGANIIVEGNTAVITGVERFSAAEITSPDLRAGAALVLAGLNADGFTIINDIKYIQRGYEDFVEKLRNLGANIRIANSEQDIRKFRLTAV